MTPVREALKTAIGHIEHMSAWIAKQKAGYSFESLGEDMPGLRASLSAAPGEPCAPSLPKRPFAFAVKRAPENGEDQWRLFMDEAEARAEAEQLDGDYEGLYRVGDRRSAVATLRREAPGSSGVADPLDDLVARFSKALLAKLKLAQANGRSGWEKDDWEADCQRGLLRHVEKGDPRDVAAYSAFMWHHGWSTSRPDAGGGVRPIVSIQPMKLSDGRTDYFVSIRVGDREVTPHVFREEYKAAYEVATYDWLLNGKEKPDLMAYGPDGWPALSNQPSPVESNGSVTEAASIGGSLG